MTTIDTLSAGEEIRNWTIHSGYLGDSFRIATVRPTYVEVEAPRAQTIQHIPRADFEKVDPLWDDYVARRLPRHSIRDRTRFSKYIISIIQHLKKGRP
jgi:hypothetical protein